MILKFHIPRPPTVNSLFANRPGGRFKTRGYEEWLTRAGHALNLQGGVRGSLNGSIKVLLTFNKGRGDIDNYAKAALDLMERHKVFENDRQVETLVLEHVKECGNIMFVEAHEKG